MVTGAIFGLLAVVLGAFGTHGLEDKITTGQIASFNTGTNYQMLHALLLLIVGVAVGRFRKSGITPTRALIAAYWLIALGVVFFSGSIYLLMTDELLGADLGFLWPVTPLGGSMLIAAWVVLLVNFLRIKSRY